MPKQRQKLISNKCNKYKKENYPKSNQRTMLDSIIR